MSRLDAFVTAARRRVDAGAYDLHGPRLVPHGPLSGALARPAAIIAELKPRSPSAGDLLPTPAAPRRTAADVLAAYTRGGAAALSVLTDGDHFGGNVALLRETHGFGLPTLMKDFVVDERQVAAAAHAGASAVLLIERILDPAAREALVAAAHAHGLEALLEVHNDADWKSASRSGADLIGVNARDLETLRVDVPAQRRLVKQIAAGGRPVVALSGVQRRQDRQAAEAGGASAVLVGTSLMRQHDPALALQAMQRPLAKVCGVRDAAAMEAAAAADADLVGIVVLSPQSPRDVPIEGARELAAQARARGIPAVLVTSCPDMDAVVAAAKRVAPSFVQWHGAPAGAGARLHDLGIGFLPAVVAGPRASIPDADGFVVDSAASGGSGTTHDWDVTRAVCDADPGRLSLVAGGLDAHNASRAIAEAGAWGADASSGLEAAPGQKDPERIKAFVAAVHKAGLATDADKAAS